MSAPVSAGLCARLLRRWRAARAEARNLRRLAAADAALRDIGLGRADLPALRAGQLADDPTRRRR